MQRLIKDLDTGQGTREGSHGERFPVCRPLPLVGRTNVLKSETRVVEINVTVNDKSGEWIRDLQKDDFTILDDGKPRAIQLFSTDADRSIKSMGSTRFRNAGRASRSVDSHHSGRAGGSQRTAIRVDGGCCRHWPRELRNGT
jgi:hypothetical protein